MDPKAPLLGFIGRLDFQKGVDLIADNYEWLMEVRGGGQGGRGLPLQVVARCAGMGGRVPEKWLLTE